MTAGDDSLVGSPLRGRYLGSYLQGRDNNLNLIRMIAASAVLVSHAYPIALGPNAIQPFFEHLGITLGFVAVAVFFVLSGFLITRSLERRSIAEFSIARILRLFPGLAVVLLLTVLILGPLVTTLAMGEYSSSLRTYTYFPRNLLLAKRQFDLPGVFETAPYPAAINGSLWSLFPEVVCYMGVAILGLCGLLGSKQKYLAAIGLYAFFYVGWMFIPETLLGYERLQILIHMSFPFFVGITFYKFRDHIRLNWILFLLSAGGIYFLKKLGLPYEAFSVLCAYIVFFLAYVPAGAIRAYNRLGDYSYGTYIYAFPSQQAVVHWIGPMEPVTNMALAGAATLILAILSWHYVEKPSLDLRHTLAERLSRSQA